MVTLLIKIAAFLHYLDAFTIVLMTIFWVSLLLIKKVKKVPYFLAPISLLLLFVLVTDVYSEEMIISYTKNQQLESSKELILAIEEYKEEKRHYPTQLEDLIPAYMDRLPQRHFVTNSRFYYEVAEESYLLTFSQKLSFWKEKKYQYQYGNEAAIKRNEILRGENPQHLVDLLKTIKSDDPRFADWYYLVWIW